MSVHIIVSSSFCIKFKVDFLSYSSKSWIVKWKLIFTFSWYISYWTTVYFLTSFHQMIVSIALFFTLLKIVKVQIHLHLWDEYSWVIYALFTTNVFIKLNIINFCSRLGTNVTKVLYQCLYFFFEAIWRCNISFDLNLHEYKTVSM